ncbi:MAG: spermidine/putrescine ABC transporter substrate-binding protein [Actinobacteria bacterium]|jgi:spermidine/putrescine transport system substrate-binding protein|nr:spermidine/putrescine ABC transporter substrate-binding protein [Actinomycetota bacterium]
MADKPLDPMTSAIVSAMSRRRFLRAAGIGGAAMAAAACGAKGTGGGGGGTAAPSPSTQPDKSDTEKVVNWSNWVSYIDTDDEKGTRPSLEEFKKQTGIAVTYTEDVNGNQDFYAKVRAQLEQGRDIGRDIVVLTDWMAGIWIEKAYALPLQDANIPNKANIIDALANPAFDPGRAHTMPWQSGFAGLGFNKELLKAATGQDTMKSLDDLWNPALAGKVTVLDEMRDTIGIIMMWQGNDPTNFTEDQFNQAADELQKQLDSGQIRQVTGNDYLTALENGDVIAVIGWSGDVAALGDKYDFQIPESGGTLWTDNMLIPAMAAHQKNAEAVMNYYYDPKVAAEVAAYVQYISPVKGAKEEIAKIDPSLVENQFIFPTDETLSQVKIFQPLTPAQQTAYEARFQQIIGN